MKFETLYSTMRSLLIIALLTISNSLFAQKAIVSHFAGDGVSGFRDGEGKTARFSNPNGLCVDGSGNLYVSDMDNDCIRKVSPSGLVTTFAGSSAGLQDGGGRTAKFNGPTGLVSDPQGNIYVCDYNNHCIRKVSPQGSVSTIAGNGFSGYKNGNGREAMFSSPLAITRDKSGNLFVADYNNQCIRKISPAGAVTLFAGSGKAGFADGTGEFASFNGIVSLSIDKFDNIYVVDAQNSAIRKVSPTGLVTTLITKELKGFVDSTIVIGRLKFAKSGMSSGGGITVDKDGDLFIADGAGHCVLYVDMNKKIIKIIAGNGNAGLKDGEGIDVLFNNPVELAISPENYIYVADNDNDCIRKIEIIKEKKKTKEFAIAGMITEKGGKKSIAANLEIRNVQSKKIENVSCDIEGRYKRPITPSVYRIYVTADGYLPYEQEIVITNEGEETTIFNAELTKMEIGAKAVLGNIQFTPNSASFSGSSTEMLDKLADFIKKNPNLKLQVNGHTDKGSTHEFNIKLSTDRARAVVTYLKAKGVKEGQLTFKGFGNTKPVASNESVEGRAMNRRVEFEILGQ